MRVTSLDLNDITPHEPSVQTTGSSSLITREREYGLLCTCYQHVIRQLPDGKQLTERCTFETLWRS